MRDNSYWTSGKNSLKLIELYSINKVSLVNVQPVFLGEMSLPFLLLSFRNERKEIARFDYNLFLCLHLLISFFAKMFFHSYRRTNVI